MTILRRRITRKNMTLERKGGEQKHSLTICSTWTHSSLISRGVMRIYKFLFALIIIERAVGQTVTYPLHLADHWQYYNSDLGYASTISIDKDTVMPNGQRYAIKLLNDRSDIPTYERQTDNKVFRYFRSDQMEHLCYDFDAHPGDTVNSFSRGSDTTDIFLLSIFSDTIFGVNRMHWKFFIDWNRHAIDDEEWDTIVDTIGLVGFFQGTLGLSRLEGALIGGTKFGVIDEVVRPDPQISTTISLSQNYPNPFNPTTTINFQLPKASNVQLRVYDALGREVRTILDERLTPGFHQMIFNAGALPSGVYWYRIQTESFKQAKPMLILR